MQLTRILSVALLGGAVTDGAGAGSPQTRPVSMDDCVQLALEHNLDLQIERLNPRLAQFTLSGSYSAYEPQLELSASHSSSSSPGGIDAQGRSYSGIEQEQDTFGAAVKGALPTGFNYSIGSSFTDAYGTRPGAIVDQANPLFVLTSTTNLLDGYVFQTVQTVPNLAVRDPFENASGYVGIQMSQPLLKNFWTDSARMTITLNRKNLKSSEFALQYQIMVTVTDVQVAYFALIAARENVKVQEKALQAAEQLLRENKKRVEVGVLAPLDEKQAESQVAASRSSLLTAQSSVRIGENTLKNLLTDKYSDWQDQSLEPTEKLAAGVQVFSRQDSWQKGLTQRPDLLQARLEVEKQNIRIRYDKNQLFPQLDLTGSYGQTGSGKEFSGALAGVSGGDSPSYSFGAVLSIPLSNRSARYNYRSAKAQLEQILLRLKKVEQGIMVQIDDYIAEAQTSLERVDSTRQARLYAEAALDAEQKKLENGKSTSFQVLQFQRDLTARRSEEIGALTDYNTSLARLALAEGSTLDRGGIKVQVK